MPEPGADPWIDEEALSLRKALHEAAAQSNIFDMRECLFALFNPPGIHRNVSCDRSGECPIIGVRYKHGKRNFDLCQREFDKLTEAEKVVYTAIEPQPGSGDKHAPAIHRMPLRRTGKVARPETFVAQVEAALIAARVKSKGFSETGLSSNGASREMVECFLHEMELNITHTFKAFHIPDEQMVFVRAAVSAARAGHDDPESHLKDTCLSRTAPWFHVGGGSSSMGSRDLASIASVFRVASSSTESGKKRGRDESAPRKALVVGVAAYSRKPLMNAQHDAQDMKTTLEQIGFTCTLLTDCNVVMLNRAAKAFRDSIDPGDIVLFYFAGHGVEYNSTNWLIPTDVPDAEDELPMKAFSMQWFLTQLEGRRSQCTVTILDCCRDSPLPSSSRNLSEGLCKMEPKGSLVAFACQPKKTAIENRHERNGLYTKHLLKYICKKGLRIEDLFINVCNDVSRESEGKQCPSYTSQLLVVGASLNPC